VLWGEITHLECIGGDTLRCRHSVLWGEITHLECIGGDTLRCRHSVLWGEITHFGKSIILREQHERALEKSACFNFHDEIKHELLQTTS
jgi:hypothetical protein